HIRNAQNNNERRATQFTAANEPTGKASMQRAIGDAVLINLKPKPKRWLDGRYQKSNGVDRRDSLTEQLEQGGSRSQSRTAEINWQKHAMQKPCGNRSDAKQNSCVSGEQNSPERRTDDEEMRENL